MTALAVLLGLCIPALAVRAMIRHHRSWHHGLPDEVRRMKVAGPALGNSIWTGTQSTALDVDTRRLAIEQSSDDRECASVSYGPGDRRAA